MTASAGTHEAGIGAGTTAAGAGAVHLAEVGTAIMLLLLLELLTLMSLVGCALRIAARAFRMRVVVLIIDATIVLPGRDCPRSPIVRWDAAAAKQQNGCRDPKSLHRQTTILPGTYDQANQQKRYCAQGGGAPAAAEYPPGWPAYGAG